MADKNTTAPAKPQLTAAEKIALSLGQLTATKAPASVDPRVIAEKQVGVEVDSILADTTRRFQAIFGEDFSLTSDAEAVSKLLASIKRAKPSAKKAVRGLSDEQLANLTAAPAEAEVVGAE